MVPRYAAFEAAGKKYYCYRVNCHLVLPTENRLPENNYPADYDEQVPKHKGLPGNHSDRNPSEKNVHAAYIIGNKDKP